MQFRFSAAIVVFLGSYLPLSVILLAQDYDYSALKRSFCWPLALHCEVPLANPWFSLGTFAICLLCFVVTLLLLRRVRSNNYIVVIEAKHIQAELLSYTIPYIVAFMSIGYQETGKFVGLLIFLGWMFWITHKSGQIILNPVLAAFGWKLYELTYRFPGSGASQITRALAAPAVEAGKSYAYVVFQDVVIIRSSQEDAVDHLG